MNSSHRFSVAQEHLFSEGNDSVDLSIIADRQILDALVSMKRRQLHSAWQKDFNCFQLRCNPLDHIPSDEIQMHLDHARVGRFPYETNLSHDGIQQCCCCRVTEFFDLHPEEWDCEHEDRRLFWQGRVGFPSESDRGIFAEYGSLMRKHFGMGVWVSHVRHHDYFGRSWWSKRKTHLPDTTVSYLVLAGVLEESHNVLHILNEDEREEKRPILENGYGLPVRVPQPLTVSSKAKFGHIMKVLDLQPSTGHKGQCYSPIGAADDGSVFDPELAWIEPTLEPQLTMLVKHNMKDEDEY